MFNKQLKTRDLSKIKLHTPKETAQVIRISEEVSQQTATDMWRIVFDNHKHTFVDPTKENYDEKWAHIMRDLEVGDVLQDLQETQSSIDNCKGIYSGDSRPVLVKQAEWEKIQLKNKLKADQKPDRGLRIVERIDSSLSPEEVSGIAKPQLITLSDDLIFEVGKRLQESNDQVNANIIPGGLGLEIYGPNVWLFLMRESKNK